MNSSELYSTEPSSTLLAKSAWYSLLAMAPLNEFKERKKSGREKRRREKKKNFRKLIGKRRKGLQLG